MTHKKILYGFILFLISNVVFFQTTDDLLRDPSNTIQIKFKKITNKKAPGVFIESKTNTTKLSVEAESLTPPCLIDLETGECVDTIDPINTPSSSPYAGSTPGDFSVSLSGGASYSVPISLPPGNQRYCPWHRIIF